MFIMHPNTVFTLPPSLVLSPFAKVLSLSYFLSFILHFVDILSFSYKRDHEYLRMCVRFILLTIVVSEYIHFPKKDSGLSDAGHGAACLYL